MSSHVDLLQKHGFEIHCQLQINDPENESIPRSALARRFRCMSEDDFACQTAFIQAVKS